MAEPRVEAVRKEGRKLLVRGAAVYRVRLEHGAVRSAYLGAATMMGENDVRAVPHCIAAAVFQPRTRYRRVR